MGEARLTPATPNPEAVALEPALRQRARIALAVLAARTTAMQLITLGGQVALARFLERKLVACLVDLETTLATDDVGQVEREAVRVVQLEGVCAGQRCFVLAGHDLEALLE